MPIEFKAQPFSAASPRSSQAIYALFAGALVVGLIPIFVRLSPVGPISTAFWRLALALPAFWIWRQGNAPAQQATSKGDYLRLALTGVLFAADLSVWHWSIKLTSIANATLLANFAPIFVALGEWLIFKQQISRSFILGMLTALMGTALLVGSSFQISSQNILGDLLALTAAVFYASYLLAIKNLRAHFSTPTTLFFSALASTIVLLPVSLISDEAFFSYTILGWLTLLGLAWVGHVGGQGLVTYALAHLPASFSSVVLLLQPLVATLLAVPILGEPITAWEAVGGCLALFGIFTARRATQVE